MRHAARFIPLLLATLALGCPQGDKKPTETAPLYERLGGKNAIEAVVAQMLENVKADERIRDKFSAVSNWDHLKFQLVDQICQASGGPCKYTGKSMKEAHQGMALTEADFNALVDDLVKALDKFGVAEKEKAELIAILGPMKADIVEQPGLPASPAPEGASGGGW